MFQRYVQVALCQRRACRDKQENLRQTIELIERAMATRPELDVIVFPEYSYHMPRSAQDGLFNAEGMDGPYMQEMAFQARKHHVNLIPGSFAEIAGMKSKNTCPFIDRSGCVSAKYTKIHLMDGIGGAESVSTRPGSEMCVFDTDFGRVGMLMCYDLRFPELSRSMVLKGADILFCPACFPWGNPLPPRSDHWDLLVESTALLNLTWICAVNQYGEVNGSYAFGRSMVVDPWGTRVIMAAGQEEIIYATLDMAYEQKVRAQVGTLENRRPDVYEL